MYGGFPLIKEKKEKVSTAKINRVEIRDQIIILNDIKVRVNEKR